MLCFFKAGSFLHLFSALPLGAYRIPLEPAYPLASSHLRLRIETGTAALYLGENGFNMADFIHELRYCLRQARRAPGFFSIAVLMIALGLAATTQIFTLVDALLLRPLPVRDPQSLVQLFEQQPKRPADIFFSYSF